MNPEELVAHLRTELLEGNMQHYQELFGGPLDHPQPDAYALAVRDFYARQSPADRDVLISIVRQAIIDTASTILAVLDGVACLPGYTEDFSLRYGANPEPLNGELQDLFLAAEEDAELER
jgi:hypothetical protein